ncbi:hypothetical protein LJR153_007277 [Paenibacillus sp. LjRoot153]|uniref:hypothetical protein n=1 Tax=Paenibacillus sp. LjRoot153 TaxID=3342270 RepID=UPI003ED040A0
MALMLSSTCAASIKEAQKIKENANNEIERNKVHDFQDVIEVGKLQISFTDDDKAIRLSSSLANKYNKKNNGNKFLTLRVNLQAVEKVSADFISLSVFHHITALI